MKQIKGRSPIRRNENDEIPTEAVDTTVCEDAIEPNVSRFEEESATLQYEYKERIPSVTRIQTSKNIKSNLENCEHPKPPSEVTRPSRHLLSSVGLWFSVLCALAACCYISFPDKMKVYGPHNSKTVEIEEPRESCDVLNGTQSMLSAEDYLALRVGVDETLFGKPTKPSVFTFLQNGSREAVQSMKTIGKLTQDCFGLNSPILHLDTKFFLSENITHDHGIAIELIKSKLGHGGILVVPNLQEVPALVARAFHTICDIHTPLVNKLIVYFTLTPQSLNDSSSINHSQQNKPTHLAESTLRGLWSELMEDELQPLVTRLTDQVLWLRQSL